MKYFVNTLFFTMFVLLASCGTTSTSLEHKSEMTTHMIEDKFEITDLKIELEACGTTEYLSIKGTPLRAWKYYNVYKEWDEVTKEITRSVCFAGQKRYRFKQDLLEEPITSILTLGCFPFRALVHKEGGVLTFLACVLPGMAVEEHGYVWAKGKPVPWNDGLFYYSPQVTLTELSKNNETERKGTVVIKSEFLNNFFVEVKTSDGFDILRAENVKGKIVEVPKLCNYILANPRKPWITLVFNSSEVSGMKSKEHILKYDIDEIKARKRAAQK